MTASAETSAKTSVAAGVLKKRMPDFFVVGHAKSGTTALYEMLRSHPQLYMPDLKETRFFARELHPTLQRSSSHPGTLDDYLSLFEPATPAQRTGEASPSYLRSHTAARRIAELQPQARIIAILREPTSFLRSLHLQLLEAHVETERDLRRAIEREPLRRRERDTGDSAVEQGLLYSEHVRYVEQLQRYHAAFPPEQVLVLIYDDFRADNERAVRQVLRFLEVDDTLPIQVTGANPTVRVRSPGLYGLVRSLYLGEGPVTGPIKAAIKALTPRQQRRVGMVALRRRVLYGAPPVAEDAYTRELRRRFKGEVVGLSEYIGRDLTALWGYDKLD
jgi:hypothetical protein